MVTAVKRWITYEVGDGSSVGAVVFRFGGHDLKDKKKGAFDALLTNDFPQKKTNEYQCDCDLSVAKFTTTNTLSGMFHDLFLESAPYF